ACFSLFAVRITVGAFRLKRKFRPWKIDKLRVNSQSASRLDSVPFRRINTEGIEHSTAKAIRPGDIAIDRNGQLMVPPEFRERFVEVGWTFDKHGFRAHPLHGFFHQSRCSWTMMANWEIDNVAIERRDCGIEGHGRICRAS